VAVQSADRASHCAAGAEESCITEERNRKIRFRSTNPDWRSPGWQQGRSGGLEAGGSGEEEEESGDEEGDDDDEAWLHAAAEAHRELAGEPAGRPDAQDSPAPSQRKKARLQNPV
jgi:hypothetical protein